jgi:hypothetical protein
MTKYPILLTISHFYHSFIAFPTIKWRGVGGFFDVISHLWKHPPSYIDVEDSISLSTPKPSPFSTGGGGGDKMSVGNGNSGGRGNGTFFITLSH